MRHTGCHSDGDYLLAERTYADGIIVDAFDALGAYVGQRITADDDRYCGARVARHGEVPASCDIEQDLGVCGPTVDDGGRCLVGPLIDLRDHATVADALCAADDVDTSGNLPYPGPSAAADLCTTSDGEVLYIVRHAVLESYEEWWFDEEGHAVAYMDRSDVPEHCGATEGWRGTPPTCATRVPLDLCPPELPAPCANDAVVPLGPMPLVFASYDEEDGRCELENRTHDVVHVVGPYSCDAGGCATSELCETPEGDLFRSVTSTFSDGAHIRWFGLDGSFVGAEARALDDRFCGGPVAVQGLRPTDCTTVQSLDWCDAHVEEGECLAGPPADLRDRAAVSDRICSDPHVALVGLDDVGQEYAQAHLCTTPDGDTLTRLTRAYTYDVQEWWFDDEGEAYAQQQLTDVAVYCEGATYDRWWGPFATCTTVVPTRLCADPTCEAQALTPSDLDSDLDALCPADASAWSTHLCEHWEGTLSVLTSNVGGAEERRTYGDTGTLLHIQSCATTGTPHCGGTRACQHWGEPRSCLSETSPESLVNTCAARP